MLNIFYGRARTGKTTHIMNDIARRMAAGETGMILIVPEQYSHDAERQLCSCCGDSLSLHAQVLTFTRLCKYVFEETGGVNKEILDKSGQMLVMHRALESVGREMKVFNTRKRYTLMLTSMLAAIHEFRAMCITPEKLEEMASKTVLPLSEKLRDFALVMSAYNTLLETYGDDTAMRLDLLASKIGESSVGSAGHIYFDGFVDFTAQEMRIIEELIKKKANITLCITCDLDADDSDPGYTEVFEIPHRTIGQIRSMTTDISYECVKSREDAVRREFVFTERYLFCDKLNIYNHTDTNDKTDTINIYAAPSKYSECEHAAATIWKLIYQGYRWRDIAVMARDFTEYEAICAHVFDKYEIPYFVSGKADIQNKPPIALIDAALSIAVTGWEYSHIGRYLKTGMTGISTDEISLLENYIIMWNIRGSTWHKQWKMPPSGYRTGNTTDIQLKKDEKTLIALNNLREKISAPLLKLQNTLKKTSKADAGDEQTETKDKLRALYEFLTDISLPERLMEKAADFEKRGQLRLASEYSQLQSIITDALDQIYTVLGETRLTDREFMKIVMLVLSGYSVGAIPIALDRVPMGSMAMSRRRNLKCLIILGATDENLPKLTQNAGILTDNERKTLSKLFDNVQSGFEERMYREMNMIYQTLTLPSEKLVFTYDTSSGNRPSYIVKKIADMFNISEETLTPQEYLGVCRATYPELRCVSQQEEQDTVRERLTENAAVMLYGNEIILSATQADNYYSCPYRYFLQTGLRLRPRRKAEFDAMSAGSYMHHILEGVFKEITVDKKLLDSDADTLKKITQKYSDDFVKRILLDFEGKDKRFEYIFRSYEKSVNYVVEDMIAELRSSKFTPIEFELNLKELSDTQSGFIDRVDSFESGDKLYLRVIDYKTRKSAYKFDLAEIYNGKDMQMPMYLFAMEKYGEKKFGKKPIPAGMLYMPARDIMLSASRNASDEEIDKLREKKMTRSGLILKDPVIIDAMEEGENKRYLPVKKTKEGIYAGDSLADKYQLKVLSEHIDRKINDAKTEILSGCNDCKPYYKKKDENACTYCEYFPVCRFDEQSGDKRRYAKKMKTDEVWKALGGTI